MDQLHSIVIKVSGAKAIVTCGNFNGKLGKLANGYEGIRGGHDYGLTNTAGECILEFNVTWKLSFQQIRYHLIIYQSGSNSSQIDYILVRKSDVKHVHSIKAIPGEEVVTHDQLLETDLKWKSMRKCLHQNC